MYMLDSTMVEGSVYFFSPLLICLESRDSGETRAVPLASAAAEMHLVRALSPRDHHRFLCPDMSPAAAPCYPPRRSSLPSRTSLMVAAISPSGGKRERERILPVVLINLSALISLYPAPAVAAPPTHATASSTSKHVGLTFHPHRAPPKMSNACECVRM